jgi:hypothetical protein
MAARGTTVGGLVASAEQLTRRLLEMTLLAEELHRAEEGMS